MTKEGAEDNDDSLENTVEYFEITAFKKRWYSAFSKLQKLCENQPNVRLPVINLPEFSSSY